MLLIGVTPMGFLGALLALPAAAAIPVVPRHAGEWQAGLANFNKVHQKLLIHYN
jgi:hypothetical protein